ncbi:MAG: 16S rRNA (uracil(1498)-N(3))-methyltransferase [bacterium]|nr:16S rRNA (uracil(1498)-N(3))-methyltransferase [bacterium]
MRLFYDAHIDPNSATHQLSEEESKHIVRVLRGQVGDTIGMLDGNGHLFTCKIADAHPKRCLLSIVRVDFEPKPTSEIHIAVAPTKQMERIEWFVEKAVEIGVTKITLLDCKNGERARIKPDRLVKKAISAMKQSQRRYLPEIVDLTSFQDFLKEHPFGLLAHCYEEEKNEFSGVFRTSNCPILIGPEGDFSEAEVAQAINQGYKPVTLGTNRLRTETAALYACMQAKLLIDRQ